MQQAPTIPPPDALINGSKNEVGTTLKASCVEHQTSERENGVDTRSTQPFFSALCGQALAS